MRTFHRWKKEYPSFLESLSNGIVVRGGDDTEVAETIWNGKAPGIRPYGSHYAYITDSEGVRQYVQFSRIENCVLHLKVVLEVTKSELDNRYYERISSEESYIVFLRYTDKPNRPWYTLEIEPGGTIRQKRSYSNEQYSDLQEAVPFLKEWQQVVQKRMDEKERKLAVESKEKRNKEFEELTVNGNIIHTGRYAGKLLVDELMKDLMEAAATA